MRITTFFRIVKTNMSIPYNFFLEKKHVAPKVLSFNETIDIIIKEEKSVSRFSDGELGIIEQNHSPGFQKLDYEMSKRLKEKLVNTKQDNLLVCIPYVFENEQLNFRTEESKKWWEKYLLRNRSAWYKYLDFDYHYGAANFTRYYMASKNKDKNEMETYFSKIKEIWNSKKVLIIEGRMTRMGVGNDLFNNTKDIKRILAPKENAFSQYEKIFKEAISFLESNKEYLVVIALGPTASILSQDISEKGYRALDMGHVDIEYEWYLNNMKKTSVIPTKYVNEHQEGKDIDEHYFEDNTYNNQIIRTID